MFEKGCREAAEGCCKGCCFCKGYLASVLVLCSFAGFDFAAEWKVVFAALQKKISPGWNVVIVIGTRLLL